MRSPIQPSPDQGFVPNAYPDANAATGELVRVQEGVFRRTSPGTPALATLPYAFGSSGVSR